MTRRAHQMPFGAEVTEAGTRFALWAPTARSVALVLDGAETPMEAQDGGWYRTTVANAGAGRRYAFRIDGSLTVPDPASRFQPDDVHKESVIVDPASFEWTDGDWRGRPWEEAVIYELHVGTVTPEGTYAGLMNRLEDLKAVGITAIELMPLADFAGSRNWGYDGVLHFAPDAAYGTPDDLKRLIDRAHALGLMVFIDVVYNHFGPTGNYLHAYAKSFFTERHQTPWGAGINFDGKDARPVRDFFIHNALYWLKEFHADGLRFDAVHAILDDSENNIIAEIAAHARRMLPDREVHLILENDANQARWLPRDDDGRPGLHTAQWNDDLHHCWHTLLTGEADGYYVDYAVKPVEKLGRALAEGFVYQGDPSEHRGGETRGEPSGHLPPTAFVAFVQNHDQIGNRAFGERLSDLVTPERLDLARAGLLLSPQIPMLYMGEEWSASAPFLYFVDFADDEALSKAVREGRAREFGQFKSFSERADERPIPDPTVEDTFTASRLDWDEIARSPHREVLADTKRLLALRRTHVVPLIGTAFRGGSHAEIERDVLSVLWKFSGGTLRFAANFSDVPVSLEVPEGEIIWISRTAAADGRTVDLAPWTGFFEKVTG
ncbi:malto-oligosyltrehalose trehalohydrolase [Microvirga pudoricolor]|uniref:malto-oligosyltrehalose trehalohydrolase n=1 Tax=Microvirga pudoricolor TaxID=2778729 RepID=UPI00194DD2A6|nr:malto-oligosyltrehalose trehalohydrolase [Microvirga pudoricolor]MBM6593272.1 malto-oligosyltrehalose trehalohydrolase [Microvirga pudoricolor]